MFKEPSSMTITRNFFTHHVKKKRHVNLSTRRAFRESITHRSSQNEADLWRRTAEWRTVGECCTRPCTSSQGDPPRSGLSSLPEQVLSWPCQLQLHDLQVLTTPMTLFC